MGIRYTGGDRLVGEWRRGEVQRWWCGVSVSRASSISKSLRGAGDAATIELHCFASRRRRILCMAAGWDTFCFVLPVRNSSVTDIVNVLEPWREQVTLSQRTRRNYSLDWYAPAPDTPRTGICLLSLPWAYGKGVGNHITSMCF
jgi:hypothetical protein